MGKTTKFRDQHDELLRIATEISAKLNVETLSKDASEARSLLSQLLGKLNLHLALEDKSLYPSLLEHSDDQVKSMANKFMTEMGNIGEAVAEYKAKWPSPHQIQNNPTEFIDETKGIFEALANRIDRENNELYKMVDGL